MAVGVLGSGLDVPSRKPVTTEGGRIRPPMRLRGEANVDGVPPEPTGGSGTCRTGPEHVAPITGYGAKAPVGFPCWMSRSTPACHIGKERPIRGACRRASPAQAGIGLPHGASPRAPLPHLEGRTTASRRAAPVRRRARVSQRGHPRACPEDLGSRSKGTNATSPHAANRDSRDKPENDRGGVLTPHTRA